MSIERTYYCDAAGCETHARTAARHRTAMDFLRVTEHAMPALHFCSWDCLMRHAAAKEPSEIVPLDGEDMQ